MLQRALGLFAFFAAILMTIADARAERRVALVIGNAHYVHASTLQNPINDATDMAGMLKGLGFEVVVMTDLDQLSFARKIDEFGRLLDGADVGLFFYAGHGVQVNGKNYLVSTKAKLESEFLVPAETIDLDSVIRLMESRTRINLVFLDACRNNPLADKLRQNLVAMNRAVALGRGLARIEPTGRDTLVAFAAAPGQEAADGRGRNSPFTAALLDHLPKPDVEVSVMLKRVTAQVRRETRNVQRPQQLSDMSQVFYFAKAEPAVAKTEPGPAAKPARQTPDHAIELAYWNSARTANDCGSVRAYLGRFPNGIFADLAKLAERRLCEQRTKVASIALPKPVWHPAATRKSDGLAPPASDAPSAEAVAPAPVKTAALPTEPQPAPSADKGPDLFDLARDIQHELDRVGCGVGRPDGIWGSRTRSALASFSRHARVKLDTDEPSQEALAAVKKHRKRVCPAVATRSRSTREAAPVRRQVVREREPEPQAAAPVVQIMPTFGFGHGSGLRFRIGR